MSKYSFKKIVDKKVNSFAFNYLKEKAEKHSKSQNILKELEGQTILKRKSYLKDNVLHKTDAQLLFSLRSKMMDVKSNFRNLYNNDMTCRICKQPGSYENEDYLLICEVSKKKLEISLQVPM